MSDPDGVNVKLTNIIAKLTTEIARLALIQTSTATTSIDLSGFITNVMPYIVRITDAVEAIAAATGSAPGGPTTTLAGLLTIIQDQTRCAPQACPPGPDDAEGCIDPFVSINQFESADYPGRLFAAWLMTDLALGLTNGTFLAHHIEDVELIHAATVGWKVYVQSTGAGSCSVNPDSGASISTNRWVSIDQYQDMAFNVPVGADIKVYLCNPTEQPFDTCVDIISGPAHYTSSTNGVTDGTDRDLQAIAWDTIPALDCFDTLSWNDGNEHLVTLDQPCSFIQGEFAGGYSIHWVSGADPVLVSYLVDLVEPHSHTLTAASPNYNIPSAATNIYVTNANADSPADSPFTISFCPPGV
jgi:hypothetical protein